MTVLKMQLIGDTRASSFLNEFYNRLTGLTSADELVSVESLHIPSETGTRLEVIVETSAPSIEIILSHWLIELLTYKDLAHADIHFNIEYTNERSAPERPRPQVVLARQLSRGRDEERGAAPTDDMPITALELPGKILRMLYDTFSANPTVGAVRAFSFEELESVVGLTDGDRMIIRDKCGPLSPENAPIKSRPGWRDVDCFLALFMAAPNWPLAPADGSDFLIRSSLRTVKLAQLDGWSRDAMAAAVTEFEPARHILWAIWEYFRADGGTAGVPAMVPA